MYKKSYNSNEVAIWGELVRRYISFHKGKDMEQITQWGLSNWGEVSPLIKKGYVQTNDKKENKVIWYKPNKEIINLIIRPSVEIATKALGDTTEFDFGSCDAYVLEILNSKEFDESLNSKKSLSKLITKVAAYLYEIKSEPDGRGTLTLPNNYDLTFEFEGVCELELRKHEEEHISTINNVSFGLVNKGDWVSVNVFENHIETLFKETNFTTYQINKYLKEVFN